MDTGPCLTATNPILKLRKKKNKIHFFMNKRRKSRGKQYIVIHWNMAADALFFVSEFQTKEMLSWYNTTM